MSSLPIAGASLSELVRAAKDGDELATRALVLGNGSLRRMVEAIKRDADPHRIAQRWEPMPEKGKPDEAEAAARLGILEALERFDPARGVAFTTFAYPFIKGAVLRALYARVRRAGTTQPSVRLVDLELGAAEDETSTSPAFERLLLGQDPGYGTEPGYAQVIVLEEYAMVRNFVAALPENQQTIVRQLYFDNRTQDEIAAERGVSRQAISKALNKALAHGREFLDAEPVAA